MRSSALTNGSKVAPHSAEHKSSPEGYQAGGHSPLPPAQPAMQLASDLISVSRLKTALMEHASCDSARRGPCVAAAQSSLRMARRGLAADRGEERGPIVPSWAQPPPPALASRAAPLRPQVAVTTLPVPMRDEGRSQLQALAPLLLSR